MIRNKIPDTYHYVPFMTGYEQGGFEAICGLDATGGCFYTTLSHFVDAPVRRCQACETTVIKLGVWAVNVACRFVNGGQPTLTSAKIRTSPLIQNAILFLALFVAKPRPTNRPGATRTGW